MAKQVNMPASLISPGNKEENIYHIKTRQRGICTGENKQKRNHNMDDNEGNGKCMQELLHVCSTACFVFRR